MDRRYFAGRRIGAVQTYKNAIACDKATYLGKEVNVVKFSETPEAAIAAYKARWPNEGEPDIVWEMIPRAIVQTIVLGEEQ